MFFTCFTVTSHGWNTAYTASNTKNKQSFHGYTIRVALIDSLNVFRKAIESTVIFKALYKKPILNVLLIPKSLKRSFCIWWISVTVSDTIRQNSDL